MNSETYALIKLGMVPGIGNAYARKLLTHFGSAAAIFESSTKILCSLIGPERALHIRRYDCRQAIDRELSFIHQQKVTLISILDKDYPQLLRHIPDAPYLLYYQGQPVLNHSRTIAIVGSRQPTEYGKIWTQELVKSLIPYNVVVVSGLAYGIDSVAHSSALQYGIPTLGVLAHGLDRIYPAVHERMAEEMKRSGGLLTEYCSCSSPDRQNFPMRNRIVAGIADAVIVVETGIKGGAMITAKLALGYDRDVMAVPGRTSDLRSEGCNYLIKTQMAQLVTDVSDMIQLMGWDASTPKTPFVAQSQLFAHCNTEERQIIDLMEAKTSMHIDELQLRSGVNSSQLANILLQLEFRELVSSLPGKRYQLTTYTL